jgi:hypothetical protein
MKYQDLTEAVEKKITGTNCANCYYASSDREPVKKSELDSQGGLKIKDRRDLELARDSDLVTLPGRGTPTEKFFCSHPKVKQYVTERQCCMYWDADGVYRAYGKKVVK